MLVYLGINCGLPNPSGCMPSSFILQCLLDFEKLMPNGGLRQPRSPLNDPAQNGAGAILDSQNAKRPWNPGPMVNEPRPMGPGPMSQYGLGPTKTNSFKVACKRDVAISLPHCCLDWHQLAAVHWRCSNWQPTIATEFREC